MYVYTRSTAVYTVNKKHNSYDSKGWHEGIGIPRSRLDLR